ncbi:MAG: hypothetical protein ABEN55_20065 [Bradymonadaceae bacterium]
MTRDDLFFDANVAELPSTSSFDSEDERADIEVRWLTLELLEVVGGQPRYATELDVRRILLAIERWTDADAPSPTAAGQVCRGLYLMTYGLHRPALHEFERALDGRVDGELEPIARLALEAHAFSLLHIGCERDAREEFERLIRRQLTEQTDEADADPAPAAVEHVTELVAVLRLVGAIE